MSSVLELGSLLRGLELEVPSSGLLGQVLEKPTLSSMPFLGGVVWSCPLPGEDSGYDGRMKAPCEAMLLLLLLPPPAVLGPDKVRSTLGWL